MQIPSFFLNIPPNIIKKIFFFTTFLCLALAYQITTAQVIRPTLHCVNRLTNNTVQITWTPNDNCGLAFTSYNIYTATTQSGTYTLAGTVADFNLHTFNDPNAANNLGTLFYYVTVNCNGVESTTSDTLDTLNPPAPELISATVISDTITQIAWQTQYPAPETYGFIIYKADNFGNFTPFDTIYNPSNAFYQDIDAQAGTRAEAYKIAAFDSCGINPGLPNEAHTTVFLKVQRLSDCGNDLKLLWTEYKGWTDGVKQYEVIEEKDGNAQIIATLSPTELSYNYNLTQGQTKACFRINAKRNNNIDVSNSNKVCVDINITESPQFICIQNVTVLNNDSVQITFLTDTSGIENSIRIVSGEGAMTNANTIKTLNNSQTNPILYQTTYTHANINPNKFNYFYQIIHTDLCNNQIQSSVASTILLEVQDQFNFTNALSWTPFELENATVTQYQIYRQLVENEPFELIATTTNSTYTDSIAVQDPTQTNTAQQICYKIIALYDLNCPDTTPLTDLQSASNVACITPSARMHVPNAFAPNGVNKIFKPVILFPNPNNYKMVIVNRWGQHLFSTNNPDEGWDGTISNGELAPQGAYVYYIEMKTQTNFTIQRKGSVLLIR